MEKFTFKASIDALEERVAVLEAAIALLTEASTTSEDVEADTTTNE